MTTQSQEEFIVNNMNIVKNVLHRRSMYASSSSSNFTNRQGVITNSLANETQQDESNCLLAKEAHLRCYC